MGNGVNIFETDVTIIPLSALVEMTRDYYQGIPVIPPNKATNNRFIKTESVLALDRLIKMTASMILNDRYPRNRGLVWY